MSGSVRSAGLAGVGGQSEGQQDLVRQMGTYRHAAVQVGFGFVPDLRGDLFGRNSSLPEAGKNLRGVRAVDLDQHHVARPRRLGFPLLETSRVPARVSRDRVAFSPRNVDGKFRHESPDATAHDVAALQEVEAGRRAAGCTCTTIRPPPAG